MPGVFTSLHRERVRISGAAFYLRLSGIARPEEFQLEVQLNRRGFGVPTRLRWAAVAVAVVVPLLLGSSSALLARHYLHAQRVAQPLPGVTVVQPQPLPTVGQTVEARPLPPPPDQILLQVPFTTQAPLNNWTLHQESCEAATLSMLISYWRHQPAVVIDPKIADGMIAAIDSWKPQPDLTDKMMGDLAQQHWGYTYEIVPNDPKVIATQLAAGRPLIAEVRTHGLGNPHYPGYGNHFEQQGWSVPHFILIIGYDSTGVFLNDPGISWGRGYHITYAQLSHAIDDLDQHHPSLAQGQVLLLIAPEEPQPNQRFRNL
jgi:peptidase C39-like protein